MQASSGGADVSRVRGIQRCRRPAVGLVFPECGGFGCTSAQRRGLCFKGAGNAEVQASNGGVMFPGKKVAGRPENRSWDQKPEKTLAR